MLGTDQLNCPVDKAAVGVVLVLSTAGFVCEVACPVVFLVAVATIAVPEVYSVEVVGDLFPATKASSFVTIDNLSFFFSFSLSST